MNTFYGKIVMRLTLITSRKPSRMKMIIIPVNPNRIAENKYRAFYLFCCQLSSTLNQFTLGSISIIDKTITADYLLILLHNSISLQV